MSIRTLSVLTTLVPPVQCRVRTGRPRRIDHRAQSWGKPKRGKVVQLSLFLHGYDLQSNTVPLSNGRQMNASVVVSLRCGLSWYLKTNGTWKLIILLTPNTWKRDLDPTRRRGDQPCAKRFANHWSAISRWDASHYILPAGQMSCKTKCLLYSGDLMSDDTRQLRLQSFGSWWRKLLLVSSAHKYLCPLIFHKISFWSLV